MEIKLGDFGLVLHLGLATGKVQDHKLLCKEASCSGTPSYMAPEVPVRSLLNIKLVE